MQERQSKLQTCPKCDHTSAVFFYSTKCNQTNHFLCPGCLNIIYEGTKAAGVQAARKCYNAKCQTMLLKREYVQKDPQEYQVDNELNVRREILAIFNMKRRDFPNEEDYDNYLEKIEEMVFTLVDSESSLEQKSAVR